MWRVLLLAAAATARRTQPNMASHSVVYDAKPPDEERAPRNAAELQDCADARTILQVTPDICVRKGAVSYTFDCDGSPRFAEFRGAAAADCSGEPHARGAATAACGSPTSTGFQVGCTSLQYEEEGEVEMELEGCDGDTTPRNRTRERCLPAADNNEPFATSFRGRGVRCTEQSFYEVSYTHKSCAPRRGGVAARYMSFLDPNAGLRPFHEACGYFEPRKRARLRCHLPPQEPLHDMPTTHG